MAKQLPTIIISILMNLYTNYITSFSRNDVFFNQFFVLNGVKQGGVISLILFCLHLDGLLVKLASEVWLFHW